MDAFTTVGFSYKGKFYDYGILEFNIQQFPCHEPSFRLIYVKHPSLMEAICNHKEAIQNWSDDITPLCTCAVLKQFPSARAFPNLKGEHWVLDGALLAPLLPDRLAQIVGGSLNNKIFPNNKELQRLFVEAFQHWTKQNAIPCPDDKWILDQFAPILADHSRRITTHITAATTRQLQEQFTNCIFHNEDKRASSLRIYCPCQYYECIDKTFLDSAIFARSHESPNDSLQITMRHLQNQFSQPIRGQWAEEPASQRDTSCQRARNIMGQEDPSLASSKPHSNRCSPP